LAPRAMLGQAGDPWPGRTLAKDGPAQGQHPQGLPSPYFVLPLPAQPGILESRRAGRVAGRVAFKTRAGRRRWYIWPGAGLAVWCLAVWLSRSRRGALVGAPQDEGAPQEAAGRFLPAAFKSVEL
jgi:hypothetical protein